MAYQVLARRWRPQRFAEVVGQDHVTRTLENAIKTARLAHAFLFCGPRGVGKTTTARILAKCLNCETASDGPVPDPCNDCGECRTDCPMQIELSDPHFLVQSNCVRCGRCVKLCPTDARRWVFGFGSGREHAGKESGVGRPFAHLHDA